MTLQRLLLLTVLHQRLKMTLQRLLLLTVLHQRLKMPLQRTLPQPLHLRLTVRRLSRPIPPARSQASTVVASRVPSPVESDATNSKADQKGKTKATPNPPNGEKKSAKDSNFIGKLNNLVTTDLQNIVQGKDFLNLCEHPHSCPSECLLKK